MTRERLLVGWLCGPMAFVVSMVIAGGLHSFHFTGEDGARILFFALCSGVAGIAVGMSFGKEYERKEYWILFVLAALAGFGVSVLLFMIYILINLT